ncbi:MAG: OmpA family protein [Sphingobacteriaceae bacterium]|nr:OmpA family protein [Sphingobacteriaceae bacterium]
MKLFLQSLLTCFFTIPFYTLAQNLVLNSGFEELGGNPGNGHVPVNCSKNWFCSNFSGTDYYIQINGIGEGVPKNMHGIQAPHSGKAYAGICIHREYIEYMGTKLAKPLIAGKTYLVEFYVSRAEKSITSVKEFGILFSEKPYKTLNKKGFAVQPSIKFTNPNGFKEEKQWVKLSTIYQAEGFEIYLTLGHFIHNTPEGVRQFSHYYIDDVSVTLVGDDENIESKDSLVVTNQSEEVVPVFSPKTNATITLENVFFETNKSDLMPESFQELDSLAQYLKQELDTKITINGHTDNVGYEIKNQNLSEARAKAVAEYLISKGIDHLRIKYNGFGSKQPIATNDSEEGRQKNRRVEFIIFKSKRMKNSHFLSADT